jgi:hypothetical protein
MLRLPLSFECYKEHYRKYIAFEIIEFKKDDKIYFIGYQENYVTLSRANLNRFSLGGHLRINGKFKVPDFDDIDKLKKLYDNFLLLK